jgi:hypothetical protein
MMSFPAVINDADGVARTRGGFEAEFGAERLLDPGPVTGSEDVGILARAAGVPCVYWLLGGADPQEFAGATDIAAIKKIVASLPSNHSPLFAPLIDRTHIANRCCRTYSGSSHVAPHFRPVDRDRDDLRRLVRLSRCHSPLSL